MGRTGQLTVHELDLVTRAAHEVDRSWNEVIGAHVNKQWEVLTEKEQQTAKNAVIGVITHDFNAEQTHVSWVAEKKSQGWTYGEVKDLERKTHPCLVSWAELPIEFRVKDELWVDTVRSFVKHLWKVPQ